MLGTRMVVLPLMLFDERRQTCLLRPRLGQLRAEIGDDAAVLGFQVIALAFLGLRQRGEPMLLGRRARQLPLEFSQRPLERRDPCALFGRDLLALSALLGGERPLASFSRRGLIPR